MAIPKLSFIQAVALLPARYTEDLSLVDPAGPLSLTGVAN